MSFSEIITNIKLSSVFAFINVLMFFGLIRDVLLNIASVIIFVGVKISIYIVETSFCKENTFKYCL